MNLQYDINRLALDKKNRINLLTDFHLFELDFVLAGAVDIAEVADIFVA